MICRHPRSVRDPRWHRRVTAPGSTWQITTVYDQDGSTTPQNAETEPLPSVHL